MRDLRTAWQVCAIEKVLVLFALNRSNIHTTCPRVSVVPVSRTVTRQASASGAVDKKAAQKIAEATVLEKSGYILDECLTQNLRGKGWISLQTIGPWFTGSTAVKTALQIVKSKHKQLKNFIADNPLVQMKQNGADFLIALAEDLEKNQASLSLAEVEIQKMESIRAKSIVHGAEIVTADETKDEREGRARSYRIQRAILELVPQILGPVLCHAWEQMEGRPWSQASSGSDLLSQVKRHQELVKRVGKDGLDKVKAGKMNKWDITLFAILLLDDPGLLPKQSAAGFAVQKLRVLRNGFVHELHVRPALDQVEFDAQWAQIKQLLRDLSMFVGKPEVQRLLESESSKILAERVDAQKEANYNKEFEHMHSDLVKLGDKVDNMEERLAGIAQNLAGIAQNQSVFRKQVAEEVAKQFAKQLEKEPEKASSSASAAGSGLTRAAVQLNTLPGQHFSFVFGKDSPDKLGTGAQGSVYRAKCGPKVIALKIPDTPAGSNLSQREWKNLEAIKHKNVIRFLGHGTLSHDGKDYDVIGMDMAVGTSYDVYVRQVEERGEKLSWLEVADDFRQIITGMSAVHAKNILHRDLKGANIIRKTNGDIVIVDFGLSKATNSALASASQVRGLKGTPAYCSPEADTPLKQTPASDVFTMGIILYELLSGFLPWAGDVDSSARSKLSTLAEGSATEMMAYVINLTRPGKPPAPLDPSEAPPSISKFVLKCLAPNPTDRFATAGEMLDPWDSAVEAAKAAAKERGTEAQCFWKAAFGEDETVEVESFKGGAMEWWAISADAAQEMANKVEADGSIEFEEFLKHFGECSMSEVVLRAQALAKQRHEEAEARGRALFEADDLMGLQATSFEGHDSRFEEGLQFPRAAAPGPTCQRGHAMLRTARGYTDGSWVCDSCGRASAIQSSGSASERWWCPLCSHDLCFSCAPAPAAPGSGPSRGIQV